MVKSLLSALLLFVGPCAWAQSSQLQSAAQGDAGRVFDGSASQTYMPAYAGSDQGMWSGVTSASRARPVAVRTPAAAAAPMTRSQREAEGVNNGALGGLAVGAIAGSFFGAMWWGVIGILGGAVIFGAAGALLGAMIGGTVAASSK